MNDTQGLTGRALGEAVIDHVLSFPEQHDQADFIDDCGRTACIAGWAITFGLDLRLPKDAGDWYDVIEADARWTGSMTETAAALLGVAGLDFAMVVTQLDRDKAISDFKHLLDVTYSEQTS